MILAFLLLAQLRAPAKPVVASGGFVPAVCRVTLMSGVETNALAAWNYRVCNQQDITRTVLFFAAEDVWPHRVIDGGEMRLSFVLPTGAVTTALLTCQGLLPCRVAYSP